MLLLWPVLAGAQTRFYVTTQADPSGLVDDATAERVQAVTDIKARLAKNKGIALVDTPDTAQVTVEVMRAGAEDSGERSVSTVTGVGNVAIINQGTKLRDFLIRAQLRSGTFATELTASLGPFGRSYGENLARKVEDWLKKNAKALAP